MSKLVVDIQLDGDQWCALVGDNLQEGEAGFGGSPNEALLVLVQDSMSQGVDLYNWTY